MLANSTLGGFSTTGPTVRLAGITFAGTLEDALNITPRDSLRYAQMSLNNLPSALPKLVEDGIMGPKTVARIKEFQRQNGLLETGVLTDPTSNLLAAKSFAARNANVHSKEIYTSGQQDEDMRKIMRITYDAIKSTCGDCKLSLDGLKIIWPEKPQGVGASIGDSIADWLPGGKKANALIDDILGATKDVATAGAKGFGQGFGATLPYAPLVYAGGAVVGIIILKKFLGK